MRTVCCVMLANGREAMGRRAVVSFLKQTYEERYRMLLILDTGAQANPTGDAIGGVAIASGVAHVYRPALAGQTIGALRNEANRRTNAEIIVHWDSDDWSHPRRIEEQVALLETSGKEAVGYRDMLFWRVDSAQPWNTVYCACGEAYPRSASRCPKCKLYCPAGEAWLYTNRVPTYALGTSLCYWREVWQRNAFADTSAGEDTLWLRGVQSVGKSSCPPIGVKQGVEEVTAGFPPEAFPLPPLRRRVGGSAHLQLRMPRMIASIHGGNTYARIEPRAEEWRRAPEWDAHCRGVMTL